MANPQEILKKVFPVLGQLHGYGRVELRADVFAGMTTAVLLVPQGMAYALLAGLPPIVGVYAALVPSTIYALFGSSRQLSVGPVAMDSLLVAAGVGAIAEAGSGEYLAAAVLLGFLVGAMQLAMGLARLGFLVNFLSVPVTSGFTSAAALVIGSTQLEHLLGLSIKESDGFFRVLGEVVRSLPNVQMETVLVGTTAIVLLVAAKKWKKSFPAALLVVVLGTAVVGAWGLSEQVSVVGSVPAGLPNLALPRWNMDQVERLALTAFTIAGVGFAESISVAKTYARRNKYSLQPNRELLALGTANLVGSLFGGYPVAGGFSRTALNAQAGARTPIASLIAALCVALTLLFLTPLFYFLPKAVLAAIIVTAVVGLIDLKEAIHLFKVKRTDLGLLLVTFFGTLAWGVVQGLVIGAAASLVWLVLATTRPHLAVLGRVPGTHLFRNVQRFTALVTYRGVLAVRMDAQFYFGNVTYLREALVKLETEAAHPLIAVILDASSISRLDSSGEAALAEMAEEYQDRGVALYLAGAVGPVRDVLERSGLLTRLGNRGRCLTVHEAVVMTGALSDFEAPSGDYQGQRTRREASRASARL